MLTHARFKGVRFTGDTQIKFKTFSSFLVLALLYFILATWLFDVLQESSEFLNNLHRVLLSAVSLAISGSVVMLINKFIQRLNSRKLGFAVGLAGALLFAWRSPINIFNDNLSLITLVLVVLIPFIIGLVIRAKEI